MSATRVGVRLWICVWIAFLAIGSAQAVRVDVVDLGIVDAHRKVDCGFAITNDSNVSRFVQGVRSSCVCLAVDVRRGELPSGGILPVKVVFNPQGMEGAVTKTMQVDFADRKSVSRVFKADVRVRVGLKPFDASFGVMKRSEMDRKLTAALTGYVPDARITGVVPPESPVFAVDVSPDGQRLTVGLRDWQISSGAYCEIWKVRTSDTEVNEVAFPVSVRVTDAISVSPHVLTFARGETNATCQIILRPTAGMSTFKVVSAETKPRCWGKTQISSRPLGGWRIVVTDIDVRELRQFSRKPFLQIVTDRTTDGVVEIPVNL